MDINTITKFQDAVVNPPSGGYRTDTDDALTQVNNERLEIAFSRGFIAGMDRAYSILAEQPKQSGPPTLPRRWHPADRTDGRGGNDDAGGRLILEDGPGNEFDHISTEGGR